jgi:hypothetical protein
MAGQAVQRKIDVKVVVVPTKGDPQEKTVSVAERGIPLGDILAEAKLSSEKKNLFVDGKPATLATLVTQGQQVRLEEKPAGS